MSPETPESNPIKVTTAAEAIRARPTMYLGSVDQKGLCRLVNLLVFEAIDGVSFQIEEQDPRFRVTRVEVTLHPYGFITVLEDGRGLPVDGTSSKQSLLKIANKSWVEIILTSLYAPARNGLAIVSALSQRLMLRNFRDGHVWQQEYRAGKPTTELLDAGNSNQSGTQVHFLPDSEIFSTTTYDFEFLAQELCALASQHSTLTIQLTDERQIDPRTGAFMQVEYGN